MADAQQGPPAQADGANAGAAGQDDEKNIAVAHLNIKIKSQDGDVVEFRVKPTTSFGKIFDAYCERKGCDAGAVRFVFEGANIGKDAKVADIDIEHGDCIDCMIQQIGGH